MLDEGGVEKIVSMLCRVKQRLTKTVISLSRAIDHTRQQSPDRNSEGAQICPVLALIFCVVIQHAW